MRREVNYFVLAAPRALWASFIVGMRKGLIRLVVLAGSCVALPAMAVYPAEGNAYIDAEIERFIRAPGFFEVDPAYFYPTRGFPIDAPLLTSLVLVLDTGRREQMARYVARELRLVASIPHATDGTHRVWTGPIWAIDELPAAPGLPELPGSPFAGTALGLSMLQAYVGRELAKVGMIARAEITLHLGVTAAISTACCSTTPTIRG